LPQLHALQTNGNTVVLVRMSQPHVLTQHA
jgi:hypothetical protein